MLQSTPLSPAPLFVPCPGLAGTHDNETAAGWWKDSAGEQDREYLGEYLGSDGADVAWDLIRAAFASVSRTTIVMMQVRLQYSCGCWNKNGHKHGACTIAAQKALRNACSCPMSGDSPAWQKSWHVSLSVQGHGM